MRKKLWGEWAFAHIVGIALFFAACLWLGALYVAIHFIVKHW